MIRGGNLDASELTVHVQMLSVFAVTCFMALLFSDPESSQARALDSVVLCFTPLGWPSFPRILSLTVLELWGRLLILGLSAVSVSDSGPVFWAGILQK